MYDWANFLILADPTNLPGFVVPRPRGPSPTIQPPRSQLTVDCASRRPRDRRRSVVPGNLALVAGGP